MKKIGLRKIIKIIWFSAAAVLFIWNWSTFQSRNLPDNTFANSTTILVTEDSDQFIFKPIKPIADFEIVFFQGGLTDPKAYAPLCRNLAERGFTCHLIKMSYRLPDYDYKKILTLFDFTTGQYVLGGHSQGGKVAAQFAYEHPTLLKGLFLLGTSHPRDIDLSNLTLPTLKLYAEHDGLASVDEVLGNKKLLPSNTQLVSLDGGNHSQFGYLGTLLMDNGATLSLEEQQKQTVEALVLFLTTLNN